MEKLLKNKITIPLEITKDMFENIIVTSLEGGSNYWYMIHSISHDTDRHLPLSSQIAEGLYDDDTFEVIFHDCETDEYLGTLTQQSLVKGIQKAFKNGQLMPNDLEEMDANIADVFLQYAVMGEIIYG